MCEATPAGTSAPYASLADEVSDEVFRSLAAELFPSWDERRLLRQLKGGNYASLDSLAKLQRTLEAANVAEMDLEAQRRRVPKSPQNDET